MGFTLWYHKPDSSVVLETSPSLKHGQYFSLRAASVHPQDRHFYWIIPFPVFLLGRFAHLQHTRFFVAQGITIFLTSSGSAWRDSAPAAPTNPRMAVVVRACHLALQEVSSTATAALCLSPSPLHSARTPRSSRPCLVQRGWISINPGWPLKGPSGRRHAVWVLWSLWFSS